MDKRRVCEALLGEGFVQSFVDFFYLTHRPEPNPGAAGRGAAAATAAHDGGGAAQEIHVPPKEMAYVRDHLARAENARRQGDTGTVYESYSALAQHYHSVGDPKTGVYFFEKCLEISRLTNDSRGEMASNHDLGLIYQSMGEPAKAAAHHERHLALAEKDDASSAEVRTAAGELVKVYRSLAAEHEACGRKDAAVQLYTKGLESSRLAKERRSEGVANYRLGRALIMLDECHRAIAYLEDYEAISIELHDREGQGQAGAALAAAYQSLQNDDKALAYLKTCLGLASETANVVAQGEACCALGVIFNKRRDYDTAVGEKRQCSRSSSRGRKRGGRAAGLAPRHT
jgi:tetratricopeptide (TPR) repeat protein